MSELLKINNLWGGYQKGVDILRGISLEVQQGEAVGIIGLNGSGKSTLGKSIMNMIPFRSGEINFNGETISTLPTSDLSNLGISIMQQGGKVFRNLSVWDNLQLAGYKANSNLTEIIPLLQSSRKELQNLMADKLSGGQKHQLSLAMTIVTSPHFVILDEPSAGLSPKAVDQMYKMLNDVKEKLNIAVLLIEQNITRAIGFCSRSLLIQKGEIVDSFTKSEIAIIEKKMFNNI